uniref:Plasmolipin n=1 Tax=Cyanistes caeruleus TaxID=156563 RepID=A0A8C0U673_CYACU
SGVVPGAAGATRMHGDGCSAAFWAACELPTEPAPEHAPHLPPQVLGLLVWSLIAATTYHLHAAYGWVMFVSLFFWILTLLFFVTYLLQLHQKFYMIPWPLVLMIYNAVATVLYITAFVTCAAAVQPTSWRQWDYNRRAAASVSSGGQGRA